MGSNINPYEIATLVSLLVTILLTVFILVRGDNRPIIRRYAINLIAIAGWNYCYYRMIVADSYSTGLFWARALHYSSSFIPATLLHFIQTLLQIENEKFQRTLRRFFYLAALPFLYLAFNSYFVVSVSSKQGFRFYIDAGPLYFLFVLFFVSSIVVVLSLLIRATLKETGFRRNQILFVLIAYSIGYLGGCMVMLPNYGLPLGKISIYGIPFGHLIILYAILRHRLMDVRVIIRRAGLLITIYSALFACLIPFIVTFHHQLLQSEPRLLIGSSVEIILISAFLSSGPFLYAYFIRRSVYFNEHTLAGLAHELKSPLATIENALEFLEHLRKSKAVDEKESEYFEMIERNSARLREFTDDLLRAFQGNDKTILLSPANCDLIALARNVIRAHTSLAAKKNIELVLVPPASEIILSVDSPKIEQVISNLLSNAIKFTYEGKITLKIEIRDGHCEISVTDTGEGIDLQDIPNIFDRFYQGAPGRRTKGTGLGLTIAKAWVEAHGGKIWAESEGEGKGTTIRFTLPIH